MSRPQTESDLSSGAAPSTSQLPTTSTFPDDDSDSSSFVSASNDSSVDLNPDSNNHDEQLHLPPPSSALPAISDILASLETDPSGRHINTEGLVIDKVISKENLTDHLWFIYYMNEQWRKISHGTVDNNDPSEPREKRGEVDEEAKKIEQRWLVRAENRYLKFMFLLDKLRQTNDDEMITSGRIIPPMDVLLFWYIHKLHIKNYVEDIARIFDETMLNIGMCMKSINAACVRGNDYIDRDSSLLWESITGEPYILSVDDDTPFFMNCPWCDSLLEIDCFSYVEFKVNFANLKCDQCMMAFHIGQVSAIRFVNDFRGALRRDKVYVGGTILNDLTGKLHHHLSKFVIQHLSQSSLIYQLYDVIHESDPWIVLPSILWRIEVDMYPVDLEDRPELAYHVRHAIDRMKYSYRNIATPLSIDLVKAATKIKSFLPMFLTRFAEGDLRSECGNLKDYKFLKKQTVTPNASNAEMFDPVPHEATPAAQYQDVPEVHPPNGDDRPSASCSAIVNDTDSIHVLSSLDDDSSSTAHASSNSEPISTELNSIRNFRPCSSALIEATVRYHKFLLLQQNHNKLTSKRLAPALDILFCYHTHTLHSLRYINFSLDYFSRLVTYEFHSKIELYTALKNASTYWKRRYKETYDVGYKPKLKSWQKVVIPALKVLQL